MPEGVGRRDFLALIQRFVLRAGFTCHLPDLDIACCRIRPTSFALNGKIERSHKIDAERMYSGEMFPKSRRTDSVRGDPETY
jgi:hypothetical protein